MAIKGYSAFLKAAALMELCLVLYPGQSMRGVLPICRGAVGVFYSPSRLGNHYTEISWKTMYKARGENIRIKKALYWSKRNRMENQILQIPDDIEKLFTYSWENWRIHAFLMDICKANILVQYVAHILFLGRKYYCFIAYVVKVSKKLLFSPNFEAWMMKF